jgi:hypothetical protein
MAIDFFYSYRAAINRIFSRHILIFLPSPPDLSRFFGGADHFLPTQQKVAAWLNLDGAHQKKRHGGSDLAAVFGMPRWKIPFQV